MNCFETIGSSTITVFDDQPIIKTDPWIEGKPYFGSWTYTYNVAKQQIENRKFT